MISEEQWRQMVDYKFPEIVIRNEDKKRVQEFEMFLARATLKKNTLSSLAEKNITIKRLPELRIVLIGNASSRFQF